MHSTSGRTSIDYTSYYQRPVEHTLVKDYFMYCNVAKFHLTASSLMFNKVPTGVLG